MYKPKDFLPAKYGSKATTKPMVSSPWNDLAKTPKIPDYERPAEMSPDHKLTELKAIDQQNQQTKTTPSAEAVTSKASLGKKPTLINQKLAGLLMVFFLVIGVFASYMLSKQNQDLRQKAYVPDEPSDPYPEGEICTNPDGCVIGWEIVEK